MGSAIGKARQAERSISDGDVKQVGWQMRPETALDRWDALYFAACRALNIPHRDIVENNARASPRLRTRPFLALSSRPSWGSLAGLHGAVWIMHAQPVRPVTSAQQAAAAQASIGVMKRLGILSDDGARCVTHNEACLYTAVKP